MALRWVGPPPTKAELRVLQNAARRGKLPKHGTIRRARAKTAKTARAPVREYESFHWGEAPKKVKHVRLPSYDGGIYELGKLRAVEYETTKGGERAIWVHQFSDPFPSLTATGRGKLGPIVGGRAYVTERGIEK
jgi:hypothetical protein